MSKFYAIFTKMLACYKIWGICHRGRNERGATATDPKMMPRNISVPVAHGDAGAKEVWRERAKDGGVIPDSGCPTGSRQG